MAKRIHPWIKIKNDVLKKGGTLKEASRIYKSGGKTRSAPKPRAKSAPKSRARPRAAPKSRAKAAPKSRPRSRAKLVAAPRPRRAAPSHLSPWIKFLKEHGGKGHTRAQLKTMYRGGGGGGGGGDKPRHMFPNFDPIASDVTFGPENRLNVDNMFGKRHTLSYSKWTNEAPKKVAKKPMEVPKLSLGGVGSEFHGLSTDKRVQDTDVLKKEDLTGKFKGKREFVFDVDGKIWEIQEQLMTHERQLKDIDNYRTLELFVDQVEKFYNSDKVQGLYGAALPEATKRIDPAFLHFLDKAKERYELINGGLKINF